MTEDISGVVINLNAFGATVRLSDGSLASVPTADVEANRATYERAYARRAELRFVRRSGGRHVHVVLIPEITDSHLDAKIAAYMKSVESWDSPDGASAHERHFLQKKRRAAVVELKHPRD